MVGEYVNPYLIIVFAAIVVVGLSFEFLLKVMLRWKSTPCSDPVVGKFNEVDRRIGPMMVFIEDTSCIHYRTRVLTLAFIRGSAENFAPRYGPSTYYEVSRLVLVHSNDAEQIEFVEEDRLFELYGDFPDVQVRLYRIKYLSVFVFRALK